MNLFLDSRNRLLRYNITKNSDIELNLEKLALQDRIHILEEMQNHNKVEGWVYGDAELLEFYGLTHSEPINIDFSEEEIEKQQEKLRSLRANVNNIHFKENKKNRTAEKTIRIYFDASQDLNSGVCYVGFVVLSHKKKIWEERGFQVPASTIYEAELRALIASIEYIFNHFLLQLAKQEKAKSIWRFKKRY